MITKTKCVENVDLTKSCDTGKRRGIKELKPIYHRRKSSNED
jgi:hypothetical protein